MKKCATVDSIEGRKSAAQLFDESPPVLVEVQFPKSGTSPDWYLCEEEDEYIAVVNNLSDGAIVILSSVWDLKNSKAVLRLTK